MLKIYLKLIDLKTVLTSCFQFLKKIFLVNFSITESVDVYIKYKYIFLSIIKINFNEENLYICNYFIMNILYIF